MHLIHAVVDHEDRPSKDLDAIQQSIVIRVGIERVGGSSSDQIRVRVTLAESGVVLLEVRESLARFDDRHPHGFSGFDLVANLERQLVHESVDRCLDQNDLFDAPAAVNRPRATV